MGDIFSYAQKNLGSHHRSPLLAFSYKNICLLLLLLLVVVLSVVVVVAEVEFR